MAKENVLVTKLSNYKGNDTGLIVTPNPLFMIIDAKTGKELDTGYRSFEEAAEAWNDTKYNIINKKDDLK